MKVGRNRVSREVPIEEPTERFEFCPEDKLEDSSPNPEEICAKGEQEAALRDAIAKLRPTLREAVELYQFLASSLHETANVLGISVPPTKRRLLHPLPPPPPLHPN